MDRAGTLPERQSKNSTRGRSNWRGRRFEGEFSAYRAAQRYSITPLPWISGLRVRRPALLGCAQQGKFACRFAAVRHWPPEMLG